MHRDFDEDEQKSSDSADAARRRRREFDCPDCNANNPVDDGFGDGSEVRCNYCGTDFRVSVGESGKLKFKEL